MELGIWFDERRERPRRIPQFAIGRNTESRTVPKTRFWSGGVPLSIVRRERRPVDAADRPTVVRAEFFDEQHQVERGSVVFDHTDAEVRQEL